MRHRLPRAIGLLSAACVGVFLAFRPSPAVGWVYHDAVPTRYAIGLAAGDSYRPNGVEFLEATGGALYDYDRVWNHPAPEPLRFKVEGSAGIATFEDRPRLLLSVNMLALHYAGASLVAGVRPYLEAGIGVIYTNFRIEGQGLRLNFNPLVGLGVEFDSAGAGAWYAAVRVHHVSNGNLDPENRGINSLVLLIGRYF